MSIFKSLIDNKNIISYAYVHYIYILHFKAIAVDILICSIDTFVLFKKILTNEVPIKLYSSRACQRL